MATFMSATTLTTTSARSVKVQELARASPAASVFASMGRIYGLMMSESDAKRMVDAWRRANKWAVPYWSGLEETYMRAMRNKGREFTIGASHIYLMDCIFGMPFRLAVCYVILSPASMRRAT